MKRMAATGSVRGPIHSPEDNFQCRRLASSWLSAWRSTQLNKGLTHRLDLQCVFRRLEVDRIELRSDLSPARITGILNAPSTFPVQPSRPRVVVASLRTLFAVRSWCQRDSIASP